MRRDEVLNQSPPYVDVDLYASDAPLQDAVAASGMTEERAVTAAGAAASVWWAFLDDVVHLRIVKAAETPRPRVLE